MREIVFDTETTGFEPGEGDRLVEIGCIELVNHIPTGKTFHQYINPERDMPAEAFAVHGLSEEFLAKHPVFAEVSEKFLEFVGEDTLVAHNAEFDMKFINAELATVGFPPIPMTQVVDTLAMARQKFPGSPASLDALCRRFDVDNSNRELHGALLDSELLAEVYLELLGGRQQGFSLNEEGENESGQQTIDLAQAGTQGKRKPRAHAPTKKELAAHKKMVEELEGAVWKDG